jgi:TP901 family phage tail tape measure protein
MDRGLSDARRKMRQFERDNARAQRQAQRSAEREAKARRKAWAGAAKAGGSVAGGAANMIGGQLVEGVQGAIVEVRDYEKALTRLQITAETTPGAMQDLSRSITKTSDATGIGRNDILQASSAFVAMGGSIDVARSSTATWAKIAQGTDTTIQDVVSSAVAMNKQLGIGGGDMEEAFSAVAAQAKRGNIELKDMAGELAQIAPQWAEFKEGKGVGGLRELGAALQVVKGGFDGDAGETIVGLQSLLTALKKNATKFGAEGIKVFDKGKGGAKELRNVFDIVDAISKSKLAKDPELLQDIFGRTEAVRAYQQMALNRAELTKLVEVSKDGLVIQRDFDAYMSSSSGRMEQSWTRVKNLVASIFTPERIEAFAGAIEQLPEKLEPIAKLLGGIGSVLGGIHSFGQNVRGVLNNDEFTASVGDHGIVNAGGYRLGGDNSDALRTQRVAGARSRLANADAYKNAVSSIAGSEYDGKSTQASIKAAFAAKYNSLEHGKGKNGAYEAGNAYLKAARVADPVEAAMQGITNTNRLVAESQMKQAIVDAIRMGFAQSAVKIGNEPIQKAGANSIDHRRGGR